MQEITVIGLTEEVVQQTIALRKQHKIKLPDAVIASTALVYGLALTTRNIQDFHKITGLILIDPHNI